MKIRSLLGVVVASLLGGCGATVALNDGDAGERDAQENAPDRAEAGVVSIAIGPAEAGAVQGADALSIGPMGSPPGCSLALTINPTVYRFTEDGATSYPFRPADEDPTGIDTQDCKDDILLEFSVITSCLPTTDRFEAWAGPTDCTQQSARVTGTDGPFCWRVAPSQQGTMTATYKIFARDLTQFIGVSSSSVLAYEPSAAVSPGPAACDTFQHLGKCGTSLAVYFMAIEGDGITIDAFAVSPLTAFPDPADVTSCGACGLALYPDAPSCQTALDHTCCAQERACGDDSACAEIVNCVNACPLPAQDSCVNACVPTGGVPSRLDLLATCSKSLHVPVGEPPAACDWPN